MKRVPDNEFSVELITPGDHYLELAVIGTGAFGTVYKAKCLETNKIVAVKKLRIQLSDEGLPFSFLREVSILKNIHSFEHPNIIRLIDICHSKEYDGPGMRPTVKLLFLVFEHIDQDLSTFMDRCAPTGIPTKMIKNFMHQMLCGVDFLHNHRILHRDLKPQNLLITNSGIVKLADFGLAKTYDPDMRLTTVVVTLWYRSPEVLLNCPYASPVDIWSLGCIMGEMLSQKPLFNGASEGGQLDKIFSVIGTPTQYEWPEDVSVSLNAFKPRGPVELQRIIPKLCDKGKDLLQRMLKFDPEQRISASEALTHDYFSDSDYAKPSIMDDSHGRTLSSSMDEMMT